MATKTIVTLIDDLDPELVADQTWEFRFDGAGYEIDLTAEHAAQFCEQMSVYVAAARKLGGRTRPTARSTLGSAAPTAPAASSASAGPGAAGAAVDTKVVREWAKAHGKPVSERGRITSSLLVEFQEAHSA